MDFYTFLVIVYCFSDDWCKLNAIAESRRGRRSLMTDAEILTLAVLSVWRVGVPWQSERGMMRYMHAYGRGWFPTLISRSAFNRRMRKLTPLFIQLQQDIAALHSENVSYEVVDCAPVRHCSLAQARGRRNHWLWGAKGRGGNDGSWFFGSTILLCVTEKGFITGWVWGMANVDDRWFMQALLSCRQGELCIMEPPVDSNRRNRERRIPTPESFGPPITAGNDRQVPIFADAGFNGLRWVEHWQRLYNATLFTPPATNQPRQPGKPRNRWLSSCRQIVETVIARLGEALGFKRINAHSETGLIARLSVIMATYNLGVHINIEAGKAPGALATLIC